MLHKFKSFFVGFGRKIIGLAAVEIIAIRLQLALVSAPCEF